MKNIVTFAGMKRTFVAKSVLAKHLGLGVNGSQIVNNWAYRGLIKKKWCENTNQYLVEKVDEKPTRKK